MIDNEFGFSSDLINAFLVGLEVASATIVATIALELYSMETAKAMYEKDRKLYLQAVALNFVNHYFYGVPVYIAAALLFFRQSTEEIPALTIATQVFFILLIHSICFYEAHKTFHSCPGYYKYHKFHHRFNTHVPPMAANAVGFVEYLFAYVLPFAVASAMVGPYEMSMRISIYIVSFTNLSIHTPKIEAWSERNIPAFWVSTHDHLEHHRKLNIHYGAPTFNVDWAVDKMSNVRKRNTTTNAAGTNSSNRDVEN